MPWLKAIYTIVLVLGVTGVMADDLRLTSGESLRGRVVKQTTKIVVLEHAILGRLKIPTEQVSSVNRDTVTQKDPESGTPESPKSQTETLTAKSSHPLDGWKSQIELGLTGTKGNSNVASFRGAFKAKKETPEDRWNADGSYFFTENGGETTSSKLTTGLIKDWLFPDTPWFTFAKGRYDVDHFKPWRSRVSGHTGLGYTFIRNENLEIIGRLGGGVTKEFGGERELRPEGLIGTTVIRWDLNESQTLSLSTMVFPDLSEDGEFRATSNADWKVKIDAARGLSLKLGIANEYESAPHGDAKHNDFKYYSTLVIEF